MQPGISSERQFGGAAERRPRTVILVMPFGLISFPDIGVSSLKAVFRQHGYPLDIRYCNLEFAHRIGVREYQSLVNASNTFLGAEYPFAREVNPQRPSVQEFAQRMLPPVFNKRLGAVRGLYQEMLFRVEKVARAADGFLEELDATLDLSAYQIIGFTTAFAQNSATWAFAQRCRRRYPQATIVVGGANCEGVMGQAQVDAFDFLDYACTGEGEDCFLELVRWIEDPERHPFPEAGIVSRTRRYVLERRRLVDVAALPPPDYDDYFEQIDRYPDWRAWYYALPVESSRGCWWGQHSQCVFCGCNGTRLLYRTKPAGKFLHDLRALRERYGERAKYFQVVDNIMPYGFFEELLPRLAKDRPYEAMFYEVKSNLKPEHLQRLREAGVYYVQPGIESLSTPVLKLMHKGVTAIANVQALKFATQYGVWLLWNVLCGIPGERPEDYAAMAELIPQLYHLNPPRGISEISIDRHSPLQEHAADYGYELQAAPAYQHLYGFSPEVAGSLAYWFDQRNRNQNRVPYFELPEHARGCQRRIQLWKNAFLKQRNVRFDYDVVDGRIELFDSRSGTGHTRCLEGAARAVVEAAERISSLEGICRRVREAHPEVSAADVTREVESLQAEGLLLQLDGSYLFLALNRRLVPERKATAFWIEQLKNDEAYRFV